MAVRSHRHRANERLAAAVADHSAIAVHYDTAINELAPDKKGVKADSSGLKDTCFEVVVVAVGREPVLPDLPKDLFPAIPGAELTIARGLYIAGDARLGALGQSGIAVGDGLQIAQMIARQSQ